MFFSMNESSYEGIRDVKARRLRGKCTSLCWAQRNAAALGETAVHGVLEAVGGEKTLQHLAELRLPLVGWLRLAAPRVEVMVHRAVGREVGHIVAIRPNVQCRGLSSTNGRFRLCYFAFSNVILLISALSSRADTDRRSWVSESICHVG